MSIENDLELPSADELNALQEARITRSFDFASYHLPQLPEGEIDSVYERLIEAEMKWASPSLTVEGYEFGSAQVHDQLLVVNAGGQILLTAEHATDHPRNTLRGGDFGTGAFGFVLQKDTNSGLILPRGLQTADANYDYYHPLKEQMSAIIRNVHNTGHIALHGIVAGRIASLSDERPYSAMIGIGNNPSPETRDLADEMMEIAKTYDLRVGINNPFLRLKKGVPIKKDDSDEFRTITFAASSANTTRTYAQEVADEAGKPYTTLQVELSSELRLMPSDDKSKLDIETEKRGTYLGYRFLKDSIELAKS